MKKNIVSLFVKIFILLLFSIIAYSNNNNIDFSISKFNYKQQHSNNIFLTNKQKLVITKGVKIFHIFKDYSNFNNLSKRFNQKFNSGSVYNNMNQIKDNNVVLKENNENELNRMKIKNFKSDQKANNQVKNEIKQNYLNNSVNIDNYVNFNAYENHQIEKLNENALDQEPQNDINDKLEQEISEIKQEISEINNEINDFSEKSSEYTECNEIKEENYFPTENVNGFNNQEINNNENSESNNFNHYTCIEISNAGKNENMKNYNSTFYENNNNNPMQNLNMNSVGYEESQNQIKHEMNGEFQECDSNFNLNEEIEMSSKKSFNQNNEQLEESDKLAENNDNIQQYVVDGEYISSKFISSKYS